jgi:hypothetical protein
VKRKTIVRQLMMDKMIVDAMILMMIIAHAKRKRNVVIKIHVKKLLI